MARKKRRKKQADQTTDQAIRELLTSFARFLQRQLFYKQVGEDEQVYSVNDISDEEFMEDYRGNEARFVVETHADNETLAWAVVGAAAPSLLFMPMEENDAYDASLIAAIRYILGQATLAATLQAQAAPLRGEKAE